MTNAAITSIRSNEKVKQCKQCQKIFKYKRATAKFCTDSCRIAHQRAKQRATKAKRIYRAESSPFFMYLAQSCRRAGTLEILHGQTLETLLELYAIYSLRLKGNYYSIKGGYEICHIFPVQHKDSIGLLHPANLVVGLKRLNQRHQAKVFDGAGKSLLRAKLEPRWKLAGNESTKVIAEGLVAYLGTGLVQSLAVKAKLQPSQRHRMMTFLEDCNDVRVPDEATLDSLSTKKLSELKTTIEGEKKKEFDPSSGARFIPWEEVALVELQRLAAHRPDLLRLVPAFTELYERVTTYQNRQAGYYHIPAELTRLQFEVLHGREVGAFLEYWHDFKNPKPTPAPAFQPKHPEFESLEAELDYIFGSTAPGLLMTKG